MIRREPKFSGESLHESFPCLLRICCPKRRSHDRSFRIYIPVVFVSLALLLILQLSICFQKCFCPSVPCPSCSARAFLAKGEQGYNRKYNHNYAVCLDRLVSAQSRQCKRHGEPCGALSQRKTSHSLVYLCLLSTASNRQGQELRLNPRIGLLQTDRVKRVELVS